MVDHHLCDHLCDIRIHEFNFDFVRLRFSGLATTRKAFDYSVSGYRSRTDDQIVRQHPST